MSENQETKDNGNVNKALHNEAYEAMLALASKYGVDLITIVDEDIYEALKVAKENGVDNADELVAKLNPKVCKNIRDDFIERMCDQWAECLEEAINNQINSGDDEEEETSEETSEESDNDA